MRSQSNSQKAYMGEFALFIVSYDLFKTRIAPLFANLVIRLGCLKRKHVKNQICIWYLATLRVVSLTVVYTMMKTRIWNVLSELVLVFRLWLKPACTRDVVLDK